MSNNNSFLEHPDQLRPRLNHLLPAMQTLDQIAMLRRPIQIEQDER